MKSPYRLCKDVWQMIPPEKRSFMRANPVTRLMVKAVTAITMPTARHQEIYDKEYYDFVDKIALESAPVMATSIVNFFAPNTLIDVGCGTGAFLSNIDKLGVKCSGLEYSEAGLSMCREKGLLVRSFDIEGTVLEEGRGGYDLSTSFEVAEHLPEKHADKFVALMCSLAPVTIMTAATPGQGGMDHVNEQPHEYWIEKFIKSGRSYDEAATRELRKTWSESGMAKWYFENVMVFRRN